MRGILLDTYVKDCMLLDEQRSLILQGIQEGVNEYRTLNGLLPDLATKTYEARFQYDVVNTLVERKIKNNPHTGLKVSRKKAGFHPYIVIYDEIRNKNVLVLRLSKTRYIFNPSGYRGEFASFNFERLLELGAPLDELLGESSYQPFLALELGTPPFGIVIGYDVENGDVFEGALRPDQGDWIYKEDITGLVINTNDVVPLNNYDASADIEPRSKFTMDDVEIEIKLKD